MSDWYSGNRQEILGLSSHVRSLAQKIYLVKTPLIALILLILPTKMIYNNHS